MRKRLLGMVGAALIASAVVAGCADRAATAPVSPSAATQPSNSLLGGLLGGVIGTVGKLLNIVVTLVERPTALSQDIVWSFDAGPDVLAFTRGGLTVVLNAGTDAVELPAGEVLMASGDVTGRLLPPDTAIWLAGTS